MDKGKLWIVGIGPGAHDLIAPRALKALEEAELVVGYQTYMTLVRKLIKGKDKIRTGMTEEIARARAAVEAAREGKKVAVISSGDPGVYGMGCLIFEVLREIAWQEGDSPDVELIPGITALNSCASLVGAPLGHDSCMISLSDLLTPWELIERRIEAAAMADFVIGFYNPASGRRQRQIQRAQEILLQYRRPTTPVALVKSAYRFREEIVQTDLIGMLDYEIGMLTTVLVGSSQTYRHAGRMVTPRGYSNKYDIADGSIFEGQQAGLSLRTPAQNLQEVQRPWRTSNV
jgi:precorrin-3B C17-methyltransferase